MSDQEQPAPRDPVKVELVVHDDAARPPGWGSHIKFAFALGLAGAAVVGILASFVGRGLVGWPTPPKECRGVVEDAVGAALTDYMIFQGVALLLGFAIVFVLALIKVRQRAGRAQPA